MPGIEATMAEDNLDLQLLKTFLRIGDTFGLLATTDRDDVICKSIVCGEKGVVLLLLNHNFRGKGKTASQWTPVNDTKVTVRIPNGMRPGHLLEVDMGFREMPFTEDAGVLAFHVSKVAVRRIYLLLFKTGTGSPIMPDSGLATGDLRVPGKEQVSSGTLEQIGEAHRSGLRLLATPLLDPRFRFEERSLLRLGLTLHATRLTMCREVECVEERVLQAPWQKCPQDACDVVRAYLKGGLRERAIVFCEKVIAQCPRQHIPETCICLANTWSRWGRYSEAATLLEAGLEHVENYEARLEMLERMIAVYQGKLSDYDQTANLIEEMLESGNVDSEGLAKLSCRMAAALLAGGRPEEAISRLKGVNRKKHQGLPVDYLLGVAYLKVGQMEEAKLCLQESVRDTRANAHKALFMIGEILLRNQKYMAARHQFLRLVKEFPNSAHASKARKVLTKLDEIDASQAR